MFKKFSTFFLIIAIIVCSTIPSYSLSVELFEYKIINDEAVIQFSTGEKFYFAQSFDYKFIRDLLSIDEGESITSKGYLDKEKQFYNKYDICKENGKIIVSFYRFNPDYDDWTKDDYEKTITINDESDIDIILTIFEFANKQSN